MPNQHQLVEIALGNLTDEQALALLDPKVLRQGGGWTAVPHNREAYACQGCHKDGYIGWKVTEIRAVW